ncbi:hypothetical protein [Pyramidobacter piscolens]|uniref:hypothetical protein n=1 Tax=Pyramidobacter piscolens TaxID=638849 RepID=UPI002AB2459E|nr:hypothetical protein [Pyramidobacter piscolens]
MRMRDGTVIDDNKHHWDAFLAGLGEDDLKEVVLVLDDAEPCIPAEAVRWGICNLTDERDEARKEAEKWRDKALRMWSKAPKGIAPLPWEFGK